MNVFDKAKARYRAWQVCRQYRQVCYAELWAWRPDGGRTLDYAWVLARAMLALRGQDDLT